MWEACFHLCKIYILYIFVSAKFISGFSWTLDRKRVLPKLSNAIQLQILFLSYQGEKQFLGMKTGGFYKGFHFSVHFNKIFCGRKFS